MCLPPFLLFSLTVSNKFLIFPDDTRRYLKKIFFKFLKNSEKYSTVIHIRSILWDI